ncbi:hypothetical protein H8356DRAFT_1018755 [Neocallimastix lanati (nom. inval.)]|uniref:Uncharacterized protein n=1 Tax=Neocallimastix californiae TaxID=1754190 RepID=A0A1Y1YQ81_9FUNG|nr:hypothetical protein H8356DRAFT_1018755 [Neocallimastix sp. JGI-2020a]ORY00188.1 hypothetical protein LY90DRAFT_641663 [Neocallimastix californiae]|eukprot:ORY00188.1 hypothetical protein LY90DRAFT_641663 [Neocallimastix californiae]
MNKFIFLLTLCFLQNFVKAFYSATVYNSTFCFEDIYLINALDINYKSLGNEIFKELLNSINFETADTTIDSFSSKNNFVIDNSNFENVKKSKVYENLINLENFKNRRVKFSANFKAFLTDIGGFLINNVYDNNNKLDIYSVEQYTKSYKNLSSYIFKNKLDENYTESLLESDINYNSLLQNDKINDTILKALLIRQIKTVNKVLIGEKLTNLDIFFTNIFCESNITLLYNMNIFTKSLSIILKINNINIEPDYIYTLFNKNQKPSNEFIVAFIQSSIKYFTNNNNDNKFVELYSTFNAINSYIYYNYNSEKKKFNLNHEYAKEVYDYLMRLENITIKFKDLDSINLSLIDYIIKKNIVKIYNDITNSEKKFEEFFTGLFQILEYFSVKNSLNYRKSMGLNEYKDDIIAFTKEIKDIRKLKILTETVNNIIMQINYTSSNFFKVRNPKNLDSKMILKPYLIIKQDREIENTNNFIENITSLKNLYNNIKKNKFSELGDQMYYYNLTTTIVDNSSIGDLDDKGLIDNFINLFNETVTAIYEKDAYTTRCMTSLNDPYNNIEYNNFKDYVSSKYQLFNKIYYDIKNYYFDLNLNENCGNLFYEVRNFTNIFDKFTYGSIFCHKNEESNFNPINYINYDDIGIKINSLHLLENTNGTISTDLEKELSKTSKLLKDVYSDQMNKINYNLYDINKLYEELIVYNHYIEETVFDQAQLNNYLVLLSIRDFGNFKNDIDNINNNIKTELYKTYDLNTDMDTILQENKNILFDNFIDKNVYQFSCDTNEIDNVKNIYMSRDYDEFMDIIKNNKTLKSEYNKIFNNQTLINSDYFSSDETNNNINKVIFAQKVLITYSKEFNDKSLIKRDENEKIEINKDLFESLLSLSQELQNTIKTISEGGGKLPEVDDETESFLDQYMRNCNDLGGLIYAIYKDKKAKKKLKMNKVNNNNENVVNKLDEISQKLKNTIDNISGAGSGSGGNSKPCKPNKPGCRKTKSS